MPVRRGGAPRPASIANPGPRRGPRRRPRVDRRSGALRMGGHACSLTFSILTRGRWSERYDRLGDDVNRDGRRLAPTGRWRWRTTHSSASPSAGPVLAHHAARLRGRLDRRPVHPGRATTTPWRSSRHAWDLGIRYFDVAPLYGYGVGRAATRAGTRRSTARRVRPLDQGRPPASAPRTTSRPAPTSTARRSTIARTPSTRTRRAAGSSSTTAPTASAGRSRRASSGSGLDQRRHRPHPRPGGALGGRDRAGLPGARTGCGTEGIGRCDRRRTEPVRDARPVRPRGRLRRLPARRAGTRSSIRTRSPSSCRSA